MKLRKSVIYLISALMLVLLPFAVSATGDDTDEDATAETYSLTLECLVNGSVLSDTEFVFGVTKTPYLNGEIITDKTEALSDFVVNTKDNTDGKKVYPFNKSELSKEYCFDFKLKSVSNKLVKIDTAVITVYGGSEVIKTVLPANPECTEQHVTATFNCTSAKEVKISTDNCAAISKVYDGKTDATVTDKNYSLSGIADGHDVKLTYEKAEFNSADVKKATKVTVSGLKLIGADADKYALSVDSFQCKASVTPRPLTVTADKLIMTIGQAEPTLTYKLSEELIPGNEPVGTLARAAGNTAGEYAVTRGTLSFGDNYDITFVDGTLTISSFSYAEVTDSATSIKITGYFDPSATVSVSALDPQSDIYSNLAAATSWGTVVSAYDVSFSASADGAITVSFPVESKYEGKSFAVYQQMESGAITCYKTTALGGLVTVTTDECTQFMLVTDKESKATDSKSSPAMTVLKVIIIILAVIVGLGLLLALIFFGMIFFNKTEQLKKIIKAVKRLFKK